MMMYDDNEAKQVGTAGIVLPTNLPTTREGMLARRKTKPVVTLNEEVTLIHQELWGENERYMLLISAGRIEDSVEDDLATDEILAAEEIQKFAKENNERYPITSGTKLGSKRRGIIHALRVTRKRFEISIMQLKEMLAADDGDAAAA